MRAVITVIGKDTVGILASISSVCAKKHANVIEVTQSVLQELFAMIMLVDISELDTDFSALADELKKTGQEMGMIVHVTHEELFQTMHTI